MRTLAWVLLIGGCGRTSLPAAECVLAYSPASLDLGEVAPGDTHSGAITVENLGAEVCKIEKLALAGDAGFSLVNAAPFSVWPDGSAAVQVTFAPVEVSLPLARSGTLTFEVNDRSQIAVPLSARIRSDCRITVTPPAIDFGHVALGDSVTREATVSNVGTGDCQIGDVALGSGSDPEFSVAAGAFDLAPGQSRTLDAGFTATEVAPPHHRTGTMVFQSTDPDHENVTVSLSADIDIGCDLTLSPPSVDFGNVILNTTSHASVTLGNDGSAACAVSGIALGPGSDPGFALSAGQPTAFTVAVGATAIIPISFGAFDSAPPHLKTGTLVFQTGNPRDPNASVPLRANIDTRCVDASQWIYTVDTDSRFSRFDPMTLSFTDISTLGCLDGSGPESMAVDQEANAWVLYTDGNLFEVDTTGGACSNTSFQPNQDGLLQFGMGFVFDPSTGLDTLYIAGGSSVAATQSTLATISFPSLVVTPIGTTPGGPELSGTGDGTLWGFFPSVASASGVATLEQIDPATGAVLESHEYPSLTGGAGWAMKFWGGFFWIFLDSSVFKVDRAAPQTITTVIADTGRTIVGAGVSSCAPLR